MLQLPALGWCICIIQNICDGGQTPLLSVNSRELLMTGRGEVNKYSVVGGCSVIFIWLIPCDSSLSERLPFCSRCCFYSYGLAYSWLLIFRHTRSYVSKQEKDKIRIFFFFCFIFVMQL